MNKGEYISPIAVEFPTIPQIPGAKIKTLEAKLRYSGRDDLCAIIFHKPIPIAATFTTSKTPGAPIDWNKQALKQSDKAKAIIINAGNANAFTGKSGKNMCQNTAEYIAQALNCKACEIWLASTGVIGEKIPPNYISQHADKLLDQNDNNWINAARSIATTDTFPKGACKKVKLAGSPITIAAIAKGSGMIAPDLATMLSFIVTDANLSSNLLHKALLKACNKSFNCLSVDSDCSTSDMVVIAATGQAEHAPISESSQAYSDFVNALSELCTELARSIACDGEGAKKLITVKVTGADNDSDARRVALSIANSPLVKTAIAGEDANWGRVVMAIGKSGAKVLRDELEISFGDYVVARLGEAVVGYDESVVSDYMKLPYIDIGVDLHCGGSSAEVWSCDLTYDYIRINADYRS